MNCRIEFSMDNDCFVDGMDYTAKKILHQIADKFDVQRITDYDKMKIFDIDGNSIGYIQITDN